MRRVTLGALVMGAAVWTVACGAAPTPPSSPAALQSHTTEHFVFHYPPLDAQNIVRTGQTVEAEYARILTDLGAVSMPTVRVTFYLEHSALEAATVAVAGVVPPWASGLVTGADQIHMMSLSLTAWGPYVERLPNLVHEFAHSVSLRVNPQFANRPRWLWESVAVYEAGQFVDPRRLSYLTEHRPPSFNELSGFDNTRVYDVGYLIAEFIVTRWGRGALLSSS